MERDEVGNPILLSGTNTDITERKKMEDTIRDYLANLESRVKERTVELVSRNRELQDFVSIASHDLQEPLRKITIFSSMLENELSDSLSESVRGHLNRISGAAQRMRTLIKSLLQFSSVINQARPFERINLKEIAEEVLQENLYGLVEEQQAQVEISDLPEIDADPIQISQLFQNLIANAIRYSKDGDRPKVKIKCEEKDDKWIKIKVEDNGMGFDMKYLEKIFQPFERLSTDGKTKGTGMGLAICKKIAERHGGTITAESRSGEGAIFIVELPNCS